MRSSAAVMDGVVYIQSGDMYLYALDALTGSPRWKSKTGPQVYWNPPSPAVAQGVVYIGANAEAQAYSAADGTRLWSTTISEIGTQSPIMANGVVYIAGTTEGSFWALDAASGSPLWSFTAGNIVMDAIVANGMVFVGSLDANLYAFRPNG